eukprot:1161585-Pelagomonas_calceolata.AAC.2
MGTCDELALDVLINSFMGFSRDLAGLKRIVVGGANRDWPLPDSPEDEESEGQVRTIRLCNGHGPCHGLCMRALEIPPVWCSQFDIDPMQLPEGMDEELELLDDLEDGCMQQERYSRGKVKNYSFESPLGFREAQSSKNIRSCTKSSCLCGTNAWNEKAHAKCTVCGHPLIRYWAAWTVHRRSTSFLRFFMGL